MQEKKERPITSAQLKALRLAEAYKFVQVGEGFGRDKKVNTVTAKTYVRLVFDGYLTPSEDGRALSSDVLGVSAGKRGYLTKNGFKKITEMCLQKSKEKKA